MTGSEKPGAPVLDAFFAADEAFPHGAVRDRREPLASQIVAICENDEA